MTTEFVLMLLVFSVESSHFYGGTITWKPVNNTYVNQTVPIKFVQSYQWRRDQAFCDQNTILNQSPKIPLTGDFFVHCVTNATDSCGNFTSISVDGYCTDFSLTTSSSSSQISYVEDIEREANFCIAYQSAVWPGIQSPSCNYTCYTDIAKWSLGSCIDLAERPDGLLNTAPVAYVISRRFSLNSRLK